MDGDLFIPVSEALPEPGVVLVTPNRATFEPQADTVIAGGLFVVLGFGIVVHADSAVTSLAVGDHSNRLLVIEDGSTVLTLQALRERILSTEGHEA